LREIQYIFCRCIIVVQYTTIKYRFSANVSNFEDHCRIIVQRKQIAKTPLHEIWSVPVFMNGAKKKGYSRLAKTGKTLRKV